METSRKEWSGNASPVYASYPANCQGGPATTKVGIYGWRKRCLYCSILILMLMVIVNLVLTVWIIRVMDFNLRGMGNLRITKEGMVLQGESEFLDSLTAVEIESRQDLPLKLESAQNITLNARNEDGKIVNRLVIGDHKVESFTSKFIIKNREGKNLFTVDDQGVEVSAGSLTVTGDGGAVFEGSVQTPLITPGYGKNLRLESRTRDMQITAPMGISLQSHAGDIAAACHDTIKLESVSGSIKLDAHDIQLKNLPQADASSNNQDILTKVYQLCACENGKLFLAPPTEACRASLNICV